MRTKLQVSTDVAAFGIWDSAADRHKTPLESLAQRGEACILQLGGDQSGAVEVFVDEDVPADLLAESLPVRDERTVVVRSGDITIDGVEHFDGRDQSAGVPSRSRIPNGTYLTRIRITKNEDELPEPKSEKEIRRVVGAEEVAFHDRANRNGLLIGLSTLLLFPALLFLVRWYIALPVAIVVFVGYFHVLQWVLQRNTRYQKVAEKITSMRLAGERPLLIIQFSKWNGAPTGGAAIDCHSDEALHAARRS